MPFAQGSRSQLTYILESTFDTLPSSPAMIKLPINTHSVALQKQIVESDEIRSDRQLAVSRHGNKSVGGDILVELRPLDYDDLLEGALFGDFDSSGELRLGTTFKSFSLEDGALDINQYRVFSGCVVDSCTINVAPNAMVTANFSMVGSSAAAISGSSVDATPTEPQSDQPFDSFSGSISEGGSQIATVTSLEFSINNSVNPAYVVGTDTAPQMEYGRGLVTGTMTAYFEDAVLLNKFINETESTLEFTLAGTTNYTFSFPRVKYNGGDVPLDNEQSRLINMPFVALYQEGLGYGTSLKIIRT